jgi:uncharacterized protein (TIGR02246 family)
MITKEQREVEQIARLYESFWNRHDLEGFGRLFAEDADFVNFTGEWWRSRKSIKENHLAGHTSIYKASRLTIHDNLVRITGPGSAILRSNWTLTGHTTPEGQALPPTHGVLTHVLQNQDGTWMIVASQNTERKI